MDYFTEGQKFAQKYVWNKFKNSWVTLLGGLATAVVPIGITLSDLPGVFQVFTLIPVAAVAGSFYWYKIANAEKYAREGAMIFQDYYKKQKKEALLQEFFDLSFSTKNDRDLKNEFKKAYDSFIEAIDAQNIISDNFKATAINKAEDAFVSGIKLLGEMKDISSAIGNTSLKKLRRDLEKVKEESDKEHISEKIEIHIKNESTVDELRKSLKDLTHAFEKSKLNLAQATSSLEGKAEADEKMQSMVAAMEAAKRVQQRVGSMNHVDMTRYQI